MKEEWRVIKGYEGLYEVSNLGKVRSLPRSWRTGRNGCQLRVLKGRILRDRINDTGYKIVVLSKKCVIKTKKVAHLVWDSFGDRPRDGHKLEVDHVDENPLNNCFDNLQLLTHRENNTKARLKYNSSSRFVGVTLDISKRVNIWKAQIGINGKTKYIGYFDNEYDAHLAYKKALKNLDE